MALEEEFEIEIPDEEAEKITTVQQAITYINDRRAKPESIGRNAHPCAASNRRASSRTAGILPLKTRSCA